MSKNEKTAAGVGAPASGQDRMNLSSKSLNQVYHIAFAYAREMEVYHEN